VVLPLGPFLHRAAAAQLLVRPAQLGDRGLLGTAQAPVLQRQGGLVGQQFGQFLLGRAEHPRRHGVPDEHAQLFAGSPERDGRQRPVGLCLCQEPEPPVAVVLQDVGHHHRAVLPVGAGRRGVQRRAGRVDDRRALAAEQGDVVGGQPERAGHLQPSRLPVGEQDRAVVETDQGARPRRDPAQERVDRLARVGGSRDLPDSAHPRPQVDRNPGRFHVFTVLPSHR
jgi:hypothetical protein